MKKTIENYRHKTYNFLRWTEKWTKTDMVYLAKGCSWLTFGQIISAFSSFLLAIAFANLVSPTVYGNYKYILSIAGILSAFSLTGIGNALIQSIAKGFEGSFQEAFQKSLYWGIGITLISFTGSIYYYFNDNLSLSMSLIFIGILSPIIESSKLYRHFLSGKKDFRTNTIYSTTHDVSAILILIATLFFTQNIIYIVGVFFLARALISYSFYKITLKNIPPSNIDVDPGILKYSKQLSILNILSIISQYIDKIIVFHFLGSAQLAIYTFAFIIPDRVRGILRNVSKVAFPKFSEKNRAEISKTLPRKLLIMGSLILILMVAYSLMAPFIFRIFFPQYAEAIFYSQIASLTFIGAITPVIGSVLFAQKEVQSLTTLSILGPSTKIILFLILGFYWGLIGIIISQIIFQWVLLLYYYVALKIEPKST